MTHRAIATRQAELGHFTMKASCFSPAQGRAGLLPIHNDEENIMNRAVPMPERMDIGGSGSILVHRAVLWSAGLSCEKLAGTPAEGGALSRGLDVHGPGGDFLSAFPLVCSSASFLSSGQQQPCSLDAAGPAEGGRPPALPVPTPGIDFRCSLTQEVLKLQVYF